MFGHLEKNHDLQGRPGLGRGSQKPRSPKKGPGNHPCERVAFCDGSVAGDDAICSFDLWGQQP